MNLIAAMELLNRRDGFEATEIDKQIAAVHGAQFNGHFLIDAGGVIRWSHTEAPDNPDQLGSFPGEEEIIAAAKALPR